MGKTKGVSIYPRKGRCYYYVSYPDPLRPDKYRIQKSTPFRVDDPEGMRKANAYALELARDLRVAGEGAQSERWEAWVLPFLEQQYRAPSQALTLKRYTGAWEWLSLFLIHERNIRVPRALTYQHARDYRQWRMDFKKASGRRGAGANTALLEIKTLQLIMNEAVRRGFAPSNPCLRLGMKREKVRHARELTPAELELIEARLPAWAAADPERAWMPDCYMIARYQGCRLRETRLNLSRQVDLRAGILTFLTKGKKDGEGETTTMHPKLRPLFERMVREKREFTLDYGQRPSILWRQFFDSIGLHDAWFHCLRSTVITEMARAGVPISQAMRYVLHASEEIHRAYQKLNTGDLSGAAGAIGASPQGAATAAPQLQAMLILELVKTGVPLDEAMRRVVHASALSSGTQPPAPASSPDRPARS